MSELIGNKKENVPPGTGNVEEAPAFKKLKSELDSLTVTVNKHSDDLVSIRHTTANTDANVADMKQMMQRMFADNRATGGARHAADGDPQDRWCHPGRRRAYRPW